MIRPKLFTAVNTMTDDEWSSFGKYLLMHTRKSSDNFKIYQTLLRRRKEIMDDGISESIRKKYFKSMTNKVYSNMLSRVFLWFEEWFAIEQFRSENFEKKLLLVKGYNQRGLFKLANKVANNLEKEIKDKDLLHIDYNRILSRLYYFQYFSSNPIKGSKDSTLYYDCIESFSKYVSEQSSFFLLELVNKSNPNKDVSRIEQRLLQTITHSENSDLTDLLQSALDMLRSEGVELMIDFKGKLLRSKIDKTSDLYLALTYYLRIKAAKLNRNLTSQILEHLLEIFSMSLDATSKNKHQTILPTNLFNAVNFIARISSFEETLEFISKWAPKTTTLYPDSTIRYCHAINAFRHEHYHKIPKFINGLNFDQFNYRIISMAMLCIAHFELNEEDLTSTLMHNLKKQIKRNKAKLLPNVFHGLLNLMEVIAYLQKSKYESSHQMEMRTYNSLFFRAWVEKKLN